jgi:hypothetical protein
VALLEERLKANEKECVGDIPHGRYSCRDGYDGDDDSFLAR